MTRYRAAAALAVLACFTLTAGPLLAQLPHEPPFALVGATLVDGTGRPPVPDAVVLVAEGRIRAVGPAAVVSVPAGTRTVDARGLVVIPGLFDVHVHLAAVRAVRPTEFGPGDLRAFLAAGVTTIRSAGDLHPWILELRADVATGRLAGPRILAVGPMLTAPGGHPAGTWLRGQEAVAASFTRQLADPDSARAEVRRLVEGGVDAIKAVYDAGDDRSPFGRLPRLAAPVLRAIVEEAHARGRRVLVHWGGPGDLPDVVAARPDEIEHITVTAVPDSLRRAIVEARIAVTPTLAAFARFMPPPVFERQLANVRRLAEAGARILAGSDAPLGPEFGAGVHQELELLARAGLSPLAALQAATRDAALALGLEDAGTLEPGRRADLVLLGGDPTRDIAAVRDVRMVFVEGRLAWEAARR